MSCAMLSLFSHVWLFVTPWTIARHAPLSMGFSRQECWSELPCPPPGALSNPGTESASPALAGGFFTTSATWDASYDIYIHTHTHIYTHSNILFQSILNTLWNLDHPHFTESETQVYAAAKSLQSCPTLCDPTDGSLPGPHVPGILQARTLEWVTISFSNAWKWKVKVKSLSHIQLLTTPWTVAYTRLLCPWDFPGKNTGGGCHCLLCKFMKSWKKLKNDSEKI